MAKLTEEKNAHRLEKNTAKKKYKKTKELRDVFLILLAVCLVLTVYAFVDRAMEREECLSKQDEDLYRLPVALSGEENISAMSYSFYFYRYYYEILESDGFIVNYAIHGLDKDMPLRECLYTSLRNWYDRLSEETTTMVKETMRYNSIAKKNGVTISDAENKLIEEELDAMREKAKKEGMTLDEFIGYRYCPGMTVEDVKKDLQSFYLAKKQYQLTLDELGEFSKEELESYYKENPLESLKGKENTPCVDIRMITLKDAATAKAVYDKAMANPTEEYFEQLVMENSTDDAIYYGGIYDDVVPGVMVNNVDNWLFASDRKKGDIQYFTANDVFCVIYYVDSGEESYLAYSRSELFDDRVEAFYKKMEEDYPIQSNEATIDTVILDYLATDYVSLPPMFSVFFIIMASLSVLMLGGAVYAIIKCKAMKDKYDFAK